MNLMFNSVLKFVLGLMLFGSIAAAYHKKELKMPENARVTMKKWPNGTVTIHVVGGNISNESTLDRLILYPIRRITRPYQHPIIKHYRLKWQERSLIKAQKMLAKLQQTPFGDGKKFCRKLKTINKLIKRVDKKAGGISHPGCKKLDLSEKATKIQKKHIDNYGDVHKTKYGISDNSKEVGKSNNYEYREYSQKTQQHTNHHKYTGNNQKLAQEGPKHREIQLAQSPKYHQSHANHPQKYGKSGYSIEKGEVTKHPKGHSHVSRYRTAKRPDFDAKAESRLSTKSHEADHQVVSRNDPTTRSRYQADLYGARKTYKHKTGAIRKERDIRDNKVSVKCKRDLLKPSTTTKQSDAYGNREKRRRKYGMLGFSRETVHKDAHGGKLIRKKKSGLFGIGGKSSTMRMDAHGNKVITKKKRGFLGIGGGKKTKVIDAQGTSFTEKKEKGVFGTRKKKKWTNKYGNEIKHTHSRKLFGTKTKHTDVYDRKTVHEKCKGLFGTRIKTKHTDIHDRKTVYRQRRGWFGPKPEVKRDAYGHKHKTIMGYDSHRTKIRIVPYDSQETKMKVVARQGRYDTETRNKPRNAFGTKTRTSKVMIEDSSRRAHESKHRQSCDGKATSYDHKGLHRESHKERERPEKIHPRSDLHHKIGSYETSKNNYMKDIHVENSKKEPRSAYRGKKAQHKADEHRSLVRRHNCKISRKRSHKRKSFPDNLMPKYKGGPELSVGITENPRENTVSKQYLGHRIQEYSSSDVTSASGREELAGKQQHDAQNLGTHSAHKGFVKPTHIKCLKLEPSSVLGKSLMSMFKNNSAPNCGSGNTKDLHGCHYAKVIRKKDRSHVHGNQAKAKSKHAIQPLEVRWFKNKRAGDGYCVQIVRHREVITQREVLTSRNHVN